MLLVNSFRELGWLRGLDLNQRPSGYEASVLYTNSLKLLLKFNDFKGVQ